MGKRMGLNRKHLAMDITIIFLFMAFIAVGFVFLCTDAEYNMNQQIARGYITRDAVFFEFDDPSHAEAHFIAMSDETNNQVVTYGKDAEDPDFVLINQTYDDGRTAVEKLLSSYEGAYFSALHRGLLRAVYYGGDIITPPVVEGRFFTEDECLSDRPLAVIGNDYIEQIYKENGIKYFDYLGNKYEVIGIAGLSGKSALDSLVFVNLGSLSAEEQLNGIYYFDCAFSNESLYSGAEAMADGLFGCGLKRHDIPLAFIDVVSGGMHMKTYLKILIAALMFFVFANTMIQYTMRQRMKISVMKLCSVPSGKIFAEVNRSYICDSIIGIVTGVIILIALIKSGVFSLPLSYIFSTTYALLSVAVFIFLIGLLFSELMILINKPGEVVRKL